MITSSSLLDISTWNNGTWENTNFETIKDFQKFLTPLFKEPGKYNFDETSLLFNEQARVHIQNKLYCTAPFNTVDFVKYWNDQKSKCRAGVIFKSNGNTWYLTRDYYMWLNFLPIYNKEKRKFGFADVRDVQYHIALYELLAELNNRHAAIVKCRQIASSYLHCAKLINLLWFEEGVVLKVGASLKDYINSTKGIWKYLNEYRNWLTKHTAWIRPMNPAKEFGWIQQVEVNNNGLKTTEGLKGSLSGVSFDKDATTGIGGPTTCFYHEEAGIAPRMDKTIEFLFPALESGDELTGLFIAAGSVGDLDQCEPLKELIYHPEDNSIFGVYSNLLDTNFTEGVTGLFIPRQWGMPPYIDQYGNSKVEEALLAIQTKRIHEKKTLAPSKYQYRVSQNPTNLEEAFDYREESRFPIHLLKAQQRRIEEHEYHSEHLELYRDENGKVISKASNRQPITDFPIRPGVDDKRGCLVVWERPQPDLVDQDKFGSYVGSIDPVRVGRTTTSKSLCAIYIYRMPVEKRLVKADGEVESSIEQGRIVAAWCGRHDDLNYTHEYLEMIIEWYNALTLIENNVSQFIQYMMHKKKLRYLVPKSQIMFLKELSANRNVYQEYGWTNTPTLFDEHLIAYSLAFCTEELDHETKSDGTIVKTTYGIERIPDIMLIKEMLAYVKGLNVDRLIAFTGLVAYVTVRISNLGYKKLIEYEKKDLEKSKNLYKLSISPFRHMGRNQVSENRPKRMPFKNFR